MIAFFHRILSGVVSYFGYSKNYIGMYVTTILMCLCPILVFSNSWIYAGFIIAHTSALILKALSFDKKRKIFSEYKDIHLWENVVTGSFVLFLAFSGYNLLLLVCSVYPALIIHKGLINKGSKLSFFAEATDDPTGKTYNIPLLNIKVRRSGTKFRLIVAGLSIVGIILTYLFNINIHF